MSIDSVESPSLNSVRIPSQRVSESPSSLSGSAWTVAHDFMFAHGGAERVTATIANQVLPGSNVVALAGSSRVIEELELARAKVLYPWLSAQQYTSIAPIYPSLIRREAPYTGNLLCSSYAFSHHLRAEGKVAVYCHSPLRQIWSGVGMYKSDRRSLRSALVAAATPYMRSEDRKASERARVYIANSSLVARRIEMYYGRKVAAIIAPPVNPLFSYEPNCETDTYVWAGRIVEPYKKLEMTIEAFRGTSRTLVVAGAGRDEARLRALAPANVKFVGHCGTASMANLYRSAKALIFPSEDDFGMAPVEAMSCGAPIIAYRGGGALETVEEGLTGMFFDRQDATSLRGTIDSFERSSFDRAAIAQYAKAWSEETFTRRMHQVLQAI